MLVSFFAVAPLAPEKLFNIGPLPFTNSMLFGVLAAVAVLSLFGLAARSTDLWPKSRLAFWVESLVDLVLGLVSDVFGDEKKALKHFPLLMTLFVFILVCNLSGILPGIDSITLRNHGEAIPLFRTFTTDLNSTLGLAVLSLTTVQVYAIKELGIIGHIRHYFAGNLLNPINIFIGLNEIFSEVLRLVTLSLRLFGVIYGGEALLSAILVLGGNFGWATSLPIMFLEIFFSLVQAYLFMMLTASYLTMATSHPEPQGAKSSEPVGASS